MSTKPITELSNEFSAELDGKLSASDFLKTLRACDSQIFSGWKNYSCIFDEDILESCEFVASYCAKLIRGAILNPDKRVAIVMTGCGTSGRIAFQTARRYNQILASVGIRPLFHYLISGGDSALLLSDELPEDDPVVGASDLELLVNEHGSDGTFLIGVTCGLSAPYVAGQLHYALEDRSAKVGAAVMGFNPVSLSRNAVIEKAGGMWTFKDIAKRLHEASNAPVDERRFAVLNPVVGPEPIAGSSRMKGGSVTAVLLDAICLRAVALAEKFAQVLLLKPPRRGSLGEEFSIAEVCQVYQSVHSETYFASSAREALPSIMQLAAESLRSGGRVLYVGAQSAGCMGFIDASEMPDTYGSPFDQIRGFVEGGWGPGGVENTTGDISQVSGLHRISYEHFQRDIIPTLQCYDAVVVIAHNNSLTEDTLRLAKCVRDNAKIVLMCAIHRSSMSDGAEKRLKSLIEFTSQSVIVSVSQELEGLMDYSLKLMLNALSTYAQASGRGAVYKGIMVTTGPANDKIYNRCVEIISNTAQVSIACAEIALIKAIHKVEEVDQELLNKPRSYHIAASILPEHMRHCAQIILPLSMLIATGRWTLKSAQEALKKEPRVSVLLSSTVLDKVGAVTHDDPEYAVLIDMGGTNIRVATATLDHAKFSMNPAFSAKVGQDKAVEAVRKVIIDAYNRVLVESGISLSKKPALIVMAQPGKYEESNGTVHGLANFPWTEPFHMRSLLKEISGAERIIIMDDGDAALYGEVMNRSPSLGSSTCVMFTIGTGVGCSVFHNNSIHSGSRGMIEGGHMILYPDGLLCACGQRGCLEMYCSGTAIGAEGQRKLTSGSDVQFTAEDVVREACNGNEVAQGILNKAAKHAAIGLVNVCRIVDANVIILGGGLGSILYGKVKDEFYSLTWKIHDDNKHVSIVSAMCDEPGLSGCLAVANNMTNGSVA